MVMVARRCKLWYSLSIRENGGITMKSKLLLRLLEAALLTLPLSLSAQTTLFGDFWPMGMVAAQTEVSDKLTMGVLQPQVLRRPKCEAYIETTDSLYFLSHQSDERYTAFTFDVPTAHEDGYYYYHYRALNSPEKLLTDSVYIRFLATDTTETPNDSTDNPIFPPDTVGPSQLELPQVVNLVMIDHHGFHTLRVLNAASFSRLRLTLYDVRGLMIYQNDRYQNDFNMSHLPEGTYFYRLVAVSQQTEMTKNGFVELIKSKL